MSTQAKFKGKVKFFNSTKGFGFIVPDNGDDDIFVHTSQVEGGHDPLNEGDIVEYEEGQGRKGREAKNVVRVG